MNECYGRFPSHRIVFVMAAEVFGEGPVTEYLPQIQAHAVEVVRALADANPGIGENDPRRHVKPLALVYSETAEGQSWLARALHEAMLNIVSVETTGQPLIGRISVTLEPGPQD